MPASWFAVDRFLKTNEEALLEYGLIKPTSKHLKTLLFRAVFFLIRHALLSLYYIL